MLDIQNPIKFQKIAPKACTEKKKLSTFAAPKRMRLPEAEVSPLTSLITYNTDAQVAEW